jgi:YHS domain-containing protein
VIVVGMPVSAQKPAPAGVKGANIPKLADAAATWADIQAQVTDLAQLVKEKRLDEIHPVAFEIRDLVRTLPDKSKPLGAATLGKLSAQVRIVDRLAEQLDKYGDAGNQPGTVRQHQALLKTLGTIKSFYPAGSLTVRMTGPVGSSKERELYLTPGGIYTAADIKANGNQLPTQKFRGVRVNHDLKPKPGDRICPITLTKANPGYTWVVGGKAYLFCCPPCVEEFVTTAKTDPAGIKAPEEYVKK